MLRRRKSLPFLDGLGAWLAVALLAIAAILLYTNLASAHESSTERTLSAPDLTGEDVVELSRDAVTGAVRYELSARTSVDAQQQQDLDPVYITTLGPPADGGQQAIVMPASVTVSDDDPWFGPFYTLNDPDRSVSIDILNDYGFAIAIRPSSGLCSLPRYIDSSFAIGYQTVATKGFYVRRCPGFEHLTSIRLSVTTYPDNAGYTVHYIRVISDSDPTPTRSARTATRTRTSTPTQTPGLTPSPTATPTATLEADAAATATPTNIGGRCCSHSHAYGNSYGYDAFCAGADGGGGRERGGGELDGGGGRGALCAVGVGQGQRLGADWRKQPDGHDLHALGRYSRDDLLLRHPRCERRRRDERMVGSRACDRTRGAAFDAGADGGGGRECGGSELDGGGGRGALCAVGVGQRQRVGADWRKQPDGHKLQALGRYSRDDLLLRCPRCERRWRDERMVGFRACDRTRGAAVRPASGRGEHLFYPRRAAKDR